MNSQFSHLASMGYQNSAQQPYQDDFTTTNLKRWSIIDGQMPSVDSIDTINIFDFDNTLFASAIPNPLIWSPQTANKLQSVSPFINGGWWHDASLLASTGDGIEVEEPRAWQGWWNEDVVQDVKTNHANPRALTVLLTGRSEAGYPDLIKRMVRSKGLEFHMICLKPKITPLNKPVANTLSYKTDLFEALLYTYKLASKVIVWEDRQHHVHRFKEFFQKFNKNGKSHQHGRRKGVQAQVKLITGLVRPLDQVVEITAIQRMINIHNRAIVDGNAPPGSIAYRLNPRVTYTAYHIPSARDRKALCLLSNPPISPDIVIQPSHILIKEGPLFASNLASIGGIGHTVTFRTTATATGGGNVWAIAVDPVDKEQPIITEGSIRPYVLVARRKLHSTNLVNKIKEWFPIPANRQITFQAVVGERILLDVDEEIDLSSDVEEIDSRTAAVEENTLARQIVGQKRAREPSSVSSSDDGELEEMDNFIGLGDYGGQQGGQQQPPHKKRPTGPKGHAAQRGKANTGGRGRGGGAPTGPRAQANQNNGGGKGYDNHRGGRRGAAGRGGRGGAHPARVDGHGGKNKGGGRNGRGYQDLDSAGGAGKNTGGIYEAY